IVLHALTSGFNVQDPTTAPVTFFTFFNDAKVPVSYVGLFAAPFVPSKDYEAVKQHPVVRDSFLKKGEIDIVITSPGQHNDPCILPNGVLVGLSPEEASKLEKAGWVGDIQWQPYSADKVLQVKTRMRILRIFEFDEFIDMARNPDKRVLLVLGPCRKCGMVRG